MDSLADLAKIIPYLGNPLVLVGFVLFLLFGIHHALIKSGILKPVSQRESGTIVKLLLQYGFAIAIITILAGFSYAARKTYLDNRTTVDVSAIVETLTATHENQRSRKDSQIEELTKAVTALALQSKSGDETAGVEQALKELARGETEAAQVIFRDTLKKRESEGKSALKEAAEAARHLRAIAILENVEEAVAAYKKATELDPGNYDGWIGLGDAAMSWGDLKTAENAFQSAITLGSRTQTRRDESVGLNRLGDVQVAQGDLAGALKSYGAGLEIRERLAAQDPGNAGWQRDLSVSHNKIGDVQRAQGDLAGALKSYGAGLEIKERLAAQDPGNAGWQRDLSVSHEKVGNVQVAQGNLSGALKSYGTGLEIAERLAVQDPGNAVWQRHISVSHNKIGDVQVAQGNLSGALKSYGADLEIAERLAVQDPGNAGWQRDLAFAHWRLARHSENAVFHWGQVISILKALNESGRLAPTDQKWLPIAEQNLGKVQFKPVGEE